MSAGGEELLPAFLGKVGDVVNVKRGHGRNFLIKYEKALIATKENIDFVNKKKEELLK